MPKHNTNSIHAQRLKAIRKYVNFDFDLRKPLSKYQKAKIKRYFDAYEALTARPNQLYRARLPKNLKVAQEYSQHPKGLTGFKVAFVPNSGKTEKISFKNNKMVLRSSGHVFREVIIWDIDDFIDDPYDTVERAIADSNGKRFMALCGEYERTSVAMSKSLTPETIARLAYKYSPQNINKPVSTDDNNYFGNWLFGVAAYEFDNQADFNDYQSEKSRAKETYKAEREKRKNRIIKCRKCGYKGKRKTFKKQKCPKCSTVV